MKNRLIALCATLLLTIAVAPSAFSQQQTIYYDATWQVCKKKKAKWYRIATPANGGYNIEDHYKTGELYKTGFQSSITSTACKHRNGHFVFYSRSGHKLREGDYKHGDRTGIWHHYDDESGKLVSEVHYSDDSGISWLLTYDSSGTRPEWKTEYKSLHVSQRWHYLKDDTTWFSDSTSRFMGITTTVRTYIDHIEVKQRLDTATTYLSEKCFDLAGTEIPCEQPDENDSVDFAYVEEMPKPNYDLGKYLGRNLKYPDTAREMNLEGRVIIQFTVDEDGFISNANVVKGIGESCDMEALRVIEEMPPWQPGSQNGRKVQVYFTLPIAFRLE